MRKVLAPPLFDDEELEDNRKTRDSVLPAKASASERSKKMEQVSVGSYLVSASRPC